MFFLILYIETITRIMDTSNWLDQNKRIMVGGKPYSDEDLQHLYDNDIKVFVNLTTSRELNSKQNFKYHLKLPSDIQFIHFPIRDMLVEKDEPTMDLVRSIIRISQHNRIYIHCKGGHGRTGVIAGLIMHEMCPDMSYTQVLEHIQKQHRTRKVKPNMSTPQTAIQFNQLHRIITGSSDIFFYDKQSTTYAFSNFYCHPKGDVLFKDEQQREWFSTEAYYQAHKFIGTSEKGNEYAEIIRTTSSPHFAYLLGNMGGNIRPNWKINGTPLKDIIKTYKTCVTIRADWNDVKESIMREALVYKFGGNDTMRSILEDSSDHRLVEYSPRDSYWGTFWNRDGQNRLGLLLESVRKELLESK